MAITGIELDASDELRDRVHGLVPTTTISLALVDRALQEASFIDHWSGTPQVLREHGPLWLSLARRVVRERLIQIKWGYASPNGADADDSLWCASIINKFLAPGMPLQHLAATSTTSAAAEFIRVYESGALNL